MKVAIVGSGCSGLAALWALKNDHEVHLYEASDRVGGHTNTVKFRRGDDSAMVDTGFIVLNAATYRKFGSRKANDSELHSVSKGSEREDCADRYDFWCFA